MQTIITLLFFGAAGGVLGQLVEYIYLRSLNKKFYFQRALATTVVAGITTLLNFYFVAGIPFAYDAQQVTGADIYFLILIHFGLFTSLFLDEYYPVDGQRDYEIFHFGLFTSLFLDEYYPVDGQRDYDLFSSTSYASVGVATEDFLVLTGPLQIFGGGCFGSFLIQLERLHSKWKRSKKLSVGDYVFAGIFILAGGIAVLFHKMDEIHSLTAMALGATLPLLGKKLLRILDS